MANNLVKLGPKHQITIPRDVCQVLQLEVGDVFKVNVKGGAVTLAPKQLVPKVNIVKFTPRERRLLATAKKKIEAIQNDILHSRGLTKAEATIAAKADFIDYDQRWYWLESWQKGSREAERDLRAGRYTEYATPEEFLASLSA